MLGYKESEKDIEAAVKLYAIAAEMGCREAMYDLGRCYEEGKGVPQNTAKAAEYYKEAADKGQKDAKAMLKSLKKSLK
jgi:TPR repeat protein